MDAPLNSLTQKIVSHSFFLNHTLLLSDSRAKRLLLYVSGSMTRISRAWAVGGSKLACCARLSLQGEK
jgi:hypothetical protein